MRNLDYLEKFRVSYLGDMGDSTNGAFKVKIKGEEYLVMVSDGLGWEHVSISHKHKTPSWTTMCILKDMFFDEEEVVMQLHPKKSEYVNNMKTCLHLWKPIEEVIPTPPAILVGLK